MGADSVHIAFVLQLCRDDEYVTLCNTRQADEDQTRSHYGANPVY